MPKTKIAPGTEDALEQAELIIDSARPVHPLEPDDRVDSARLDGIPVGLFVLLWKGGKTGLAVMYDALVELLNMKDGSGEPVFTLFTVSRTTGISQQKIKTLLAMKNLPPLLMAGIREGKIKTGVAYRLIKLRPDLFAKAESIFVDTGTLTGDDLHSILEAKRSAAVAALSRKMFAPMAYLPDNLDVSMDGLVDRFKDVSPDGLHSALNAALTRKRNGNSTS